MDLMKKTLFALVACMLMVCLSMPMLVSGPVTAAPVAPLRNHIIKSIYLGFGTVIHPGYVWEFYFSPVTKDFHIWRGPFQKYDSYDHKLGYDGPHFFFYVYI